MWSYMVCLGNSLKMFNKLSGLLRLNARAQSIKEKESGNIFFTLFGAVVIVGLLGTVVVSTIRGPISTMVEVQSRTKAESEMDIASRLALLEATQQSSDGDCDGDGLSLIHI